MGLHEKPGFPRHDHPETIRRQAVLRLHAFPSGHEAVEPLLGAGCQRDGAQFAGAAELLLHYGTDAQKDYYLPRLAAGTEIPCFALTSPYAGSDAAAIPDLGVVCMGMHEGRATLGFRLSWNKRYITLAPVATLLGLAFQTSDPEHLLSDNDAPGITCALIPASHDGVVIGRRHHPLNAAFQNGPTSGNDVFIPIDWVIGGQAQVGKGWRMLMECLAAGRAISLPSSSVGMGKMAVRGTSAYAAVRRQFNMPIGKFRGCKKRWRAWAATCT